MTNKSIMIQHFERKTAFHFLFFISCTCNALIIQSLVTFTKSRQMLPALIEYAKPWAFLIVCWWHYSNMRCAGWLNLQLAHMAGFIFYATPIPRETLDYNQSVIAGKTSARFTLKDILPLKPQIRSVVEGKRNMASNIK